MNNTISRLLSLVVLFSVGFSSCSDDDESISGYVTFKKTGIFFENFGDTSTSTTFSLHNVASLEIDEVPDGWSVDLEFYKGIVTVTPPASEDLITYDSDGVQENKITEITFTGTTHNGYSITSASLVVGVVPFHRYDDPSIDDQSNSLIATQPETFYIFNPTFKGEDKGEVINNIDDCKLVWRSISSSIRHPQMISDTEFGFYITRDVNDMDEDGDEFDLLHGNGVIAALNPSDDILWSWHVWCTENDPRDASETITFNNKKFMGRNLGAEINNIDTDLDIYYDTPTSNYNILASFGLYYQWGRKDPFIKSVLYNSGYDGLMYDHDYDQAYIEYEESTSSIGQLSYSIKNPLTYIMGVSNSDQDWLYRNHNDALWSDDKKSIYDPSPKGWRVPRSTDFVGITVPEVALDASSGSSYFLYAAYLNDGGATNQMFMAPGRRNYITGRIVNVNSQYSPWCGWYWTSGATVGTEATCLMFSNVWSDDTNSYTIDTQYAARRANGMQIRCVEDN